MLLGDLAREERAATWQVQKPVEQRNARGVDLDVAASEQVRQSEQVVGVGLEAVAQAFAKGALRLESLRDVDEPREVTSKLLTLLASRESLCGFRDGRDRVRGALPDQAYEQGTTLAARREADERSAERSADRRQDDLLVPDQPEDERGGDASDAEEKALVGPTREAMKHARGCVGVDCEVIDDAQNRVGHSDRIGSAT